VDLKQMKELMAAMERAGIKKLSIKEKTGYELHLERQDEHFSTIHHPVALREIETTRHVAAPQVAHVHKPIHHEEPKEIKEGRYVTSPMVGTFYTASSPDDSPFVKVGDRVEENTVVCIVEAMKVMNEVKAGVSGTVAEILIDNAHPVEFGTKILRIV
jgi:acetyl-CoA carboxylase biotin carboxyl carrier protein